MDTRELIDFQFDRAVQIVQGLPKQGPIQTGYEEKLTMYSLYKQATVGNVKAPRPGIFDMLGRAKWDAWAKHKDLDAYEAKMLYVEALLKVLKKYSDKTIARDLVQELESYGGDSSHLVISRTLSKSMGSDSSGSTTSDEHAPPTSYQRRSNPGNSQPAHNIPGATEEADDASEDETDDEARELPIVPEHHSQIMRQSSPSSLRYRTPLAGSLVMSPPPRMTVPAIQPLPGFETPSAFAGPSANSVPSSLPPATNSYAGQYPGSSSIELTSSPTHLYPAYPHYRGQSHGLIRPASRPTLERAIENVQAHLAALSERLESLEILAAQPSRSNASLSGGASPIWGGAGRGSPADSRDRPEWDIDDLGMWSLVLSPLSRGVSVLRKASVFFARSENRSPTLIIVRRLCLDASFLLCVLAAVRVLWRRSGVRRKEVRAALVVLWRAILGIKKERTMVSKGV